MPYKNPKDPRAIASRKAAKKRWRQRHPEKHVAEVTKWAKKHPEKKLAQCRAYYARNSGKVLARIAAWKRSNPEKMLGYAIARYGITLDKYLEMVAAQGGLCAICGQPERVMVQGRAANLCVDHDRSCCSGVRSCGACVRGLLCRVCNLAIGYLRDDVANLESALSYLRRFRGDR